jgi:hypothetical protein
VVALQQDASVARVESEGPVVGDEGALVVAVNLRLRVADIAPRQSQPLVQPDRLLPLVQALLFLAEAVEQVPEQVVRRRVARHGGNRFLESALLDEPVWIRAGDGCASAVAEVAGGRGVVAERLAERAAHSGASDGARRVAARQRLGEHGVGIVEETASA